MCNNMKPAKQSIIPIERPAAKKKLFWDPGGMSKKKGVDIDEAHHDLDAEDEEAEEKDRKDEEAAKVKEAAKVEGSDAVEEAAKEAILEDWPAFGH